MQISGQFKSALIVIATCCAALPALADGGATYTPGTNQHLDLQHQVGAKIYTDCGNSADAELRLPASGAVWEPSKEIRALIGTPAPEFARDLQWVNCPAMTMAQLRGHPVFVRFWYRNCKMCDVSAPMMNELQDKYAKDGLVVIGIHHSKTVGGDKPESVAKAALDLGYKFPVAMDNSWNTIGKFWIHGTQRAYSSASFLIDKNGTIVWGHDLGRLESGSPAAVSLESAIDKLLAKDGK